jgi:signal peptide peptidase SppA
VKKSELLLVKKSQIESVLGVIAIREEKRMALATKAEAGTLAPTAGAYGDMVDQMITDWASQTKMTVNNGVAVIPVRGTINPDDPFSAYYGETSLAMIEKNFKAALADASVNAIVLNVYSPGGYVYGVESMGNMIYSARGTKPVYAYTDNLAASAAYWLASAADKVFLGSETAEVGSIGVYMAHFDYSGLLEANGIKVTEITAGEFKGIGSPYTEMSKEEQAQLQSDVNYLYTRFVNTVARNRGMAVDAVLKSANGLTFYGSDAVAKGLADSVTTFQEVLNMATAAGGNTTEQQAEQAKKEQEAQASATALKAEQEKNAKLEAEVAEYRKAKAAEERTKLDTECNANYKAAFGRDATQEEKDTYAKADAATRTVMAASLKESADSRDKLVKAAGLTTEQATSGASAEGSQLSPLVLAAHRLGLATKQ